LPDELPQPLIDESQDRWGAFQQAAEAAGIPPVTDFDIIKSSKYVFAFSDFVAASCRRDPAVLKDLIDSGNLLKKRQSNAYESKLKALLADAADEDSLMRRLRCYRRREMVRIAWRDLAGWADLAETMTDLSSFADACIHGTLNVLHQWQCEISGIPRAADGSEQHLVVFGAGQAGSPGIKLFVGC
jgi:glutamate-ammonia-ligase adenylyltransferase